MSIPKSLSKGSEKRDKNWTSDQRARDSDFMQYYKSIKMEQGMQDENIDETNQMQMIPGGMYI